MTLYNVTSWNPTQRNKFERTLPFCAEGSTYGDHYIITFASEKEMGKKLSKAIIDKKGKCLNIQYTKVNKSLVGKKAAKGVKAK